MGETIDVTQDTRGVARLSLARPEKRNAMSAKMIAELTDAATRLGSDPSVRAVILAAQGDVFCAGGDLEWMRAQQKTDAQTRRREASAIAYMLQALNRIPKPLIGRISGNAFGGGVGLMAVCDVAVAAEGTKFGLTETRLGLIPATIGPYVIARMGEARARQVFMSAVIFDAWRAADLGLVTRVVPAAEIDAAVEAEVAPYLSCAPGAVAAAKALTQRLGPDIDAARIEASIDALVERWESPESVEGIAAFFDKRAPDWKR